MTVEICNSFANVIQGLGTLTKSECDFSLICIATKMNIRYRSIQQECISVGCVLTASVTVSGEGVSAWGCLPRGGGCLPRMGSATHPLWTEWLTDRCKNFTLAQTSFAGGKNPQGYLWSKACKGLWTEYYISSWWLKKNMQLSVLKCM